MCVQMPIASLFMIAKKWKQAKCPWTDKWINKMRHVHTKEDNSAITGEKHWHLLQQGWTLKTSGSVKEASHKRPRVARFHLHEMSRIGKSIESRLVVSRGLERGKWGVTAKEYGISLGGDENVLKLIVVMVAQLCECTNVLRTTKFKL